MNFYPFSYFISCDFIFYFFSSSAIQAAAVKSTSVDELSAVSVESCKIPIMKPTPIICAATSSEIPNRLHANGINNNEPPATPDAPQAHKLATRLNRIALPKETSMPQVCTAARVKMVIVIAAPAILMVAPNGIETE